jgi:iron complex transport system ATP-binding protein
MTPVLSARGITVKAGEFRLLDGVDINVFAREMLAIVGPNGAGKSTLLKVLSGDIVPTAGEVILNGRPLGAWTSQERALQRAVLPQSPELAFSFRAWDVVELGRHPHRAVASRGEDYSAIAGAMEATDVVNLAGRDCRTLSGGELHRTHFARALAQIWSPLPDGGTRVLMLDEPTASLDLYHQHAILAKATEFARAGVAVLTVLHDLNLASAYADRIVVLDRGEVEAVGTPEDVITAERLRRIWRVECDVLQDCSPGRPQVLVRPSAMGSAAAAPGRMRRAV